MIWYPNANPNPVAGGGGVVRGSLAVDDSNPVAVNANAVIGAVENQVNFDGVSGVVIVSGTIRISNQTGGGPLFYNLNFKNR